MSDVSKLIKMMVEVSAVMAVFDLESDVKFLISLGENHEKSIS